MPRSWAEVFGFSIGWEAQYARRQAARLVGVHCALFFLLALCRGRWPWAYLVVLAGLAASVSLGSGLYQIRRDIRGKLAVWQSCADEASCDPPPAGWPFRGLAGLLLHPLALPPVFAGVWIAVLVALVAGSDRA